jgi:hypothetical protein
MSVRSVFVMLAIASVALIALILIFNNGYEFGRDAAKRDNAVANVGGGR